MHIIPGFLIPALTVGMLGRIILYCGGLSLHVLGYLAASLAYTH